MSTDRIKELHEKASERYLNGDYAGAIEAWREVVALDPSDEQAESGIRMAEQLAHSAESESSALPISTVPAGHDLDEGLKVLDGIVVPDTSHLGEEGEIDLKPATEDLVPGMDELLDSWNPDPSAPAAAETSFGLEPVQRAVPVVSAAAAELTRRVTDLLTEAKAKAAAGEREEALAILSRLAILDEDNEEAEQLKASLDQTGSASHEQIEQMIIEGVSAFESGNLEEAEKLFRSVLASAPEHKEAQHYLEKIAEKHSGGHEDLLPDLGSEPPPVAPVKNAPADEPLPPIAVSGKKQTSYVETEVHQPPPPVHRPKLKLTLPPRRILIAAGVGIIVLAAGVFVIPHWLGHSSKTPSSGKASAVWTPKAKGSRPAPGTPAAKPVPSTPEERAKALDAALATAESRMKAGDYGAAVIAYNEALTLDPVNIVAKSGLATAGDHYKASKGEREALANIKLAFRDGEFTSALRLAYRLPPTVSKTYVDGIKLAGWYNLAVVAMRAGDCKEAERHLDEALQIAPGDTDAKRLHELAEHYVDAEKDRSFLNKVEALEFRSMPES